MHKTKRALIDTVITLMDGDPSVSVSLQDVLGASGIASGSLYHHFLDFQDLIDHALVDIYSAYTNAGIAGLSEIISQSTTTAEIRAALSPFIDSRHESDTGKMRVALAWIAAQATLRPNLRESLGPAQAEMTANVSSVIKTAQDKGLVKKDLNPLVIAVFIQSYSMGRIVDDLAGNQMDPHLWAKFIKDMVSDAILADH